VFVVVNLAAVELLENGNSICPSAASLTGAVAKTFVPGVITWRTRPELLNTVRSAFSKLTVFSPSAAADRSHELADPMPPAAPCPNQI